MARLLRPELLDDGSGGLCVLPCGLGAVSVVGEPVGDLLLDAAGTERRPERRGSLGDGGGPIVATLAIVAEVKRDVDCTSTRGGERVLNNYWI